jgi:hypothetical protein
MKLSDAALLERIEREPKLLRLPLIHSAGSLSVGHDEDSWNLDYAHGWPSERRPRLVDVIQN